MFTDGKMEKSRHGHIRCRSYSVRSARNDWTGDGGARIQPVELAFSVSILDVRTLLLNKS